MGNVPYITIYKDKWKAVSEVKQISEAEKAKLAKALLDFAVLGREPEGLSAIAQAFFTCICTSLSSVGHRGGQPGNRNARRKNEYANEYANECVNEYANEKTNELYTDTETNTDTETERDTPPTPSKEGKRFSPPTLEEVKAHCKDKGYLFSAEAFLAFYSSKGWKVGNQSMKDWRAACTTWYTRDKAENPDKYRTLAPLYEYRRTDTCPVCGSSDIILAGTDGNCNSCGNGFCFDPTSGSWRQT